MKINHLIHECREEGFMLLHFKYDLDLQDIQNSKSGNPDEDGECPSQRGVRKICRCKESDSPSKNRRS